MTAPSRDSLTCALATYISFWVPQPSDSDQPNQIHKCLTPGCEYTAAEHTERYRAHNCRGMGLHTLDMRTQHFGICGKKPSPDNENYAEIHGFRDLEA